MKKLIKTVAAFVKNNIVKQPVITYTDNSEVLKLKKIVSRWNKNVNVFIGEEITEMDLKLFFDRDAEYDCGAILLHYKTDVYMTTLLRDLGIAKSTTEAKGAGWHKKADNGFTELFLDGMSEYKRTSGFGVRPHRITILKTLK